MEIIVKKYEHINSALPSWDTPKGVHVKSKDHYDRLCKEAGMIPYEQTGGGPKLKDYNLSEKGRAIIEAAKNSKDKKGRVKLGSKTIDAMKEIGAIGKKIPDYMKYPEGSHNGGFYTI